MIAHGALWTYVRTLNCIVTFEKPLQRKEGKETPTMSRETWLAHVYFVNGCDAYNTFKMYSINQKIFSTTKQTKYIPACLTPYYLQTSFYLTIVLLQF